MAVPQLHLTEDRWLSKLLNRDACILHVQEKDREANPTSASSMSRSYEFFRQNQKQPVFITAKVPTDDTTAIRFLEQSGFHLVDTNVTFFISLEYFRPKLRRESGARIEFRCAEPADREAVADLARRSFRYSRFHLDPVIPDELANEIKAAWAENYFNGKRGDEMVVAIDQGKIIGFTQILIAAMTCLTIDLIAVDPSCQRRGAAAGMIDFAVSVLTERWPGLLNSMIVGTQLANQPSIALYEKIGFRMTSSQYVFHFHNPPEYQKQ